MASVALHRPSFWSDPWPRCDIREIVTAPDPDLHRAGTVVLHIKPDLELGRLQREGNVVHTSARFAWDVNEYMIYSLFADATGGEQCKVAEVAPPREGAASAQAKSRVARLTTIQTSFGVALQTLADILEISRPQLYKWLDATQAVRMQADSIRRLGVVEELAHKWRAHSMLPIGPWIHERPEGDRSLLQLLTSPRLDVGQIDRAFGLVAGDARQAPSSHAKRLREAGFKRRPTRRSLSSDE